VTSQRGDYLCSFSNFLTAVTSIHLFQWTFVINIARVISQKSNFQAKINLNHCRIPVKSTDKIKLNQNGCRNGQENMGIGE
jgi:hypothetical protein